MSFTTPITWTNGLLVTDDHLNEQIRDNMNAVQRVLNRDAATDALTNSNTQTTIFSYLVPANSLASDRMIRLTWSARFTSITGVGSQTLRIRAKFGTTSSETIFADSGAISHSDNATYELILVCWIAAANATNAQRTWTQFQIMSTGGGSTLAALSTNVSGGFPLSIDQTSDRTLLISAQFGTASTSLQLGAGQAFVELLS